MKSMTGFGRGAAMGAGYAVFVDLKTVNNRFLDVHMRTGTELNSIERQLKKRIGERLARGRVDVSVSLDRTSEVGYEVNRPLLTGYLSALRSLSADFSLPGEPDLNMLARLPGVLQPRRDGVSEEMIDGVMRAVDGALEELDRMRTQEGETLAAEMHGRLAEIEGHLPTIEAAIPQQLESYRARLARRVDELAARTLGESVELDAGRLAQEIAYLAERSDISEEVARLRSHISQFRASLAETGEVGKRLDFLSQELNREANTMLSKSTDIAIKEAALSIKTEIEKIREQVQNIE
jgi:uncharacterized protein (TIGR00255 family)